MTKRFGLAMAVIAGMLMGSFVVSNAATTFSDVPANSPYASYISDLANKFIIVGKGGNQFGPNDSLKRSEFTAMLVNAFKLKTSSKAPKFADARASWASMYIESAYEAGLVAGTSSTTFSPDMTLTREQAAEMVWHYLQSKGVAGSPATLSGDFDYWATTAVTNVVGLGLYGTPSEVTNGDYHAKDVMTREQAAALIDLALKKVPTGSSSSGSVINPTGRPTNLISHSDGTSSLGNVVMPVVISNQSSSHYLDLFTQMKFVFIGNKVTVTTSPTGSANIQWVIQDDNNNGVNGSDAETFSSTSTSVGIALTDMNTGHVLAACTLSFANNQWHVVYPQN